MKKARIVILLLAAGVGLGFVHGGRGYNEPVAAYYNNEIDSLLTTLKSFKATVTRGESVARMKKQFLVCRSRYKKISFFVEQFDPRGARVLNGPDLLRIEDDTQTDSTKPHGFQHIEAILYDAHPDLKLLATEIETQIANTCILRNAPDHEYYFRDDRVWEALRSGIYRIVALGITGFDVPMCYNALPETKEQLAAERSIFSLYQKSIEGKDPQLYKDALSSFDAAIAFVTAAKDFNSFDRLTFVRSYINPLTRNLKLCASAIDVVNKDQLTPLNPEAEGLFSADIFNVTFFSPNERFLATPERVALGRKLFYDTKLSLNNSRSCASCHKPELAFTDGLTTAKTLDGSRNVARNTPTLLNSVFQARQFYDSRALVLETQLSAVVHNKEEMGGSLQDAVPALAKDAIYASMFDAAYGREKERITQYTIANAISSYIRTLTSFNSRLDRYVRGQSNDFSPAEKLGFNLFMGKAKCGTCHYAPMFNGLVPPRYEETESEILAVPAVGSGNKKLDADPGKEGFTRVPIHRYAFKTPTIRNAALTAPYMHNGVFKTLEEVIDFYDKGGGAGYGIKLFTQTLPTEPLHLSKTEKAALVAFLRSLNDNSQK